MWALVDAVTQGASAEESAVLGMSMTLSIRERFRIRRATVYARRGLKRYKIGWTSFVNPLSSIRCWRLDAGTIVAEVRDAGVMSYCNVYVDDYSVSPLYAEERFAGFGGVLICMLRGTQHVLALIEARAASAQRALEESREA